MKFSEEIITNSVLEEVKPLLQKHWEEVAHYKDIPLDPDYTQYILLQDLNMLRSFSARDDNGKLIGYAVFLVKKHPHYKQHLYAMQDIIFIDPDRRGIGVFLIKFCDEELRKIGVHVVSHHVKFSHNWSSILERMGYEKQDIILTRRLDK